jgi:hypothetical protein
MQHPKRLCPAYSMECKIVRLQVLGVEKASMPAVISSKIRLCLFWCTLMKAPFRPLELQVQATHLWWHKAPMEASVYRSHLPVECQALILKPGCRLGLVLVLARHLQEHMLHPNNQQRTKGKSAGKSERCAVHTRLVAHLQLFEMLVYMVGALTRCFRCLQGLV